MFKRIFFIVPGLIFIFSCNNNEKKVENNVQESELKEEINDSPANCYKYADSNDTISLKVIRIGQSITGTLIYNLKEKDKNTGTIQGSMKNDLLVADYTFMSEGIQSVRQVVFKSKDKSFVEGFGEIYSGNNKMLFKNLDSLKFNDSIKLTEVPCN